MPGMSSSDSTDVGSVCLLCGSDAPLGTGLCASCVAPDAGRWWRQRLVFLERLARRDREEVENRVRDLLGEIRSDSDILAAVRGELPLVRVPSDVVERVARHLRESGLPVRIVHPAGVGARLTPALGLTLGAAIGLGMVAGLVAATPMLVLTPMFGVVVAGAVLRRQGPSLLAPAAAPALPSGMENRVRESLAGIPDGAARRLLADLLRMTRELYGSGMAAGLEGPLKQLLDSAARLAADLGGIDDSLAIIDGQAGAHAEAPGWTETRARLREVRDRLEDRLVHAITALARARSAGSESVLEEEKRLAEIVEEIEREAVIQAEAHRELESLLA
jgi:hypothetical protein